MASQSYLAESYLVLAVRILLLPEDGLFFLPCSPLSSGNVAWPRGGSLCLLLGSSGEAGKEKINSGCLDFLARPERGDLPGSFPYMARLLWAGSLLQAPPPPRHLCGRGATTGHLGLWCCRGWAGLKEEGRTQDMSLWTLHKLASYCGSGLLRVKQVRGQGEGIHLVMT